MKASAIGFASQFNVAAGPSGAPSGQQRRPSAPQWKARSPQAAPSAQARFMNICRVDFPGVAHRAVHLDAFAPTVQGSIGTDELGVRDQRRTMPVADSHRHRGAVQRRRANRSGRHVGQVVL